MLSVRRFRHTNSLTSSPWVTSVMDTGCSIDVKCFGLNVIIHHKIRHRIKEVCSCDPAIFHPLHFKTKFFSLFPFKIIKEFKILVREHICVIAKNSKGLYHHEKPCDKHNKRDQIHHIHRKGLVSPSLTLFTYSRQRYRAQSLNLRGVLLLYLYVLRTFLLLVFPLLLLQLFHLPLN